MSFTQTWEVFFLSWDEIDGQKHLATAYSKAEADELVDRFSELLPNAYVDYKRVCY